ncbi:dihydroxyacetone kinase subunit DhaK [Aeromicrobium duanguangcaii]|uniref:Dihydroxyacetone kinase subunit DhaK n=1 Tax=Aeromicrobium duanguangcaii TaxID=2968086 RepID=A0ABY5KHH4_9ACTN|nr:dihydroxyacetone kinase subunit DhaK [Aeromicrobium duanguangcaii]MCD9153669.1 dihydroxyacetone kinase subunit DhaK [Aeromicrobium duanguangcaii]UUI69249.1 dihydroxyacetone kinase subunit DhaK [Aeromicrobium duanguangcaii]
MSSPSTPSPSTRALRGIAITAGDQVGVSRDPVYVWALAPAPGRRVAIVSGGGAGHEPLHGGFVGAGGLDAACPGEVFTSPHSRQIFAASDRVKRDGGVLQIVKNYTGDRINFAIAAERLRARGVDVAEVVVDDDLGSEGHDVGRRGTGATLVVEKILGAAADRGLRLEELADLGTRVASRSRSVAVARQGHTAPDSRTRGFEVEPGSLEYGVGIHGEAARQTIDELAHTDLAQRMVDELLEALGDLPHGVIAVVNGLGGAPNLELLGLLGDVELALQARGIELHSGVAGTYISALDMDGFSITLTEAHPDWIGDWYAPHVTAGLPSPRPWDPDADRGTGPEDESGPAAEPSPWLRALADHFDDHRADYDDLDRRAGDGDFGANMQVAFASSVARAAGPDASLADDLRSMADAFGNDVGGSSGPLLGLVLTGLAEAVEDAGDDDLPAAVGEGLRAGMASVTRAGGAEPGDRTFLDALAPAVAEDGTPLDGAAVQRAADGAAATADLVGKRGRSSYVGDKAIGVPDPGAVALVQVLAAIVERITGDDLGQTREQAQRLLHD